LPALYSTKAGSVSEKTILGGKTANDPNRKMVEQSANMRLVQVKVQLVIYQNQSTNLIRPI
jgi:hypothetical protein